MIRWVSVVVGIGLVVLAARAAEPEAFAWVWNLAPTEERSVWRVPLTDDVMRSLHRADASDLLITDAEGTPIPFQRLRERFLIEPLSQRQRLSLRASAVDAGQPERPGLELELTLGGTRLVVNPPAVEQGLGDRDRLVFEALIGSAEAPALMNEHRLRLDFLSPTAPGLDCRLRAAEDDGPASRRVNLEERGDSRPRQFLASVELETLPRAWHLACYGRSAVPELELTDAWLVSVGQRQHRTLERLSPVLEPDPEQPGAFEFKLDGPYRTLALELDARQPNLVSSVQLLSRASPDQAWQPRGRLTLSTLPDAPKARLEIDSAGRHRFWRLVSEPALRNAPELELEVPVEELVFLAQGPSPWQLYAGSRTGVELTAQASLLANAVSALGPAWRWPRLEPGPRSEAGGPAVLQPPAEPTDWRRYGLWLVLILGASLVAGLALSLLMGRGKKA